MARINTYNNDTSIQGADKLIGSDVDNGTKNYRIKDVAKWMSDNGQIGVAGQSTFVFQAVEDTGRKQGSVSFDAFGGDGSDLGDIVELVFSERMSNGNNNTELIQGMINDQVMLSRMDDTANFGIFKLLAWELHPTEMGFYVGTFQLIQASGTLKDEEAIALKLYSVNSGDKTFTHYQTTAATIWNVTHNLGKKPSVSVVTSADAEVVGQVDYVDDSSLTITFKNAFKGKAYLN